MRTLSAPLQAAQIAGSGAPFLRTEVLAKVRAHLDQDFTEQFSDGAADEKHDAAADATYLHRVRINGTPLGHPQYERNAGSGWTNLNPATIDTQAIAVAVINDTRVGVVYNRGSNIFFVESTDQGVSFSAEALIVATTAAPKAVGIAYKNTAGDLALFWEDGAAMKRIRRTAGTFGSVTTWTQSANTINGVAAKHAGDFLLALTGTDANDRPFVKTLILGDGADFAVDLWTAFFTVLLAEVPAEHDLTFDSPHLGISDVWQITYNEDYAGTPTYTRTYSTTRPAADAFSPGDWEWLDPAPLPNITNNGYAITGNATTLFLSRPAQVLEAPVTPSPASLDMSLDLIEATIKERGPRGEGTFVFDNSNSQYKGPPSAIQLFRDLDIGLGYDALFSRPARQSIVGWEYRKDGGRGLFVLFTRGLDYWLERSNSRTTIDLGSNTFSTILRGSIARAGIDLVNAGISTRAQTLTLAWTFHPHVNGLSALLALLALMPDMARPAGIDAIEFFEPLAADTVDYDYTTLLHSLYHSKAHTAPSAHAAEVIGTDDVVGQAFDFPNMGTDKPIEERRRDPHSATAADAADHAAAALRQAVIASDRGSITTPPNVGLEVGDVISYNDDLAGGDPIKARVRALTTRFRRAGTRTAVYEQTVQLGGV